MGLSINAHAINVLEGTCAGMKHLTLKEEDESKLQRKTKEMPSI